MATLRPTVHRRGRLFPDRLSVCPWKDASIDDESDGVVAVNILHYCFCRSRVDEEQSAIESQSAVHGAQPVLDHHQWNAPGTIHRTIAANHMEEWNVFRNL